MDKGKACILVRKSDVDADAIRQTDMTDHDLWEDLRGKRISRLEQVEEARLERGGKLSVIKAHPKPKIVDVRVRDGVQTIRIEIGT
jgi:uncharacterized membrane protein YcaP (DUF421 family)